MGNRIAKSNHTLCQELFCERPDLLLPKLIEHYDGSMQIKSASQEHPLYNGKPYPITNVDVMLKVETAQGESCVLVEIKGSSDPFLRIKQLRKAGTQLRRHFRKAQDGKISSPTSDMMLCGIAVVGGPDDCKAEVVPFCH